MKLLVIGLDGATFQVIDPLVARGELPGLARLMAGGTRVTLESTLPPLSPTAWASFITGKNPGKHGVFDFLRRRPGSYEFLPVNGASIRARTLWSRLSEGGVRVGVVNVPMTYPPPPVNGFIISGMDSPRLDQSYTYPAELAEEIHHQFGGYRVGVKTRGARNLSPEEFTPQYAQSLYEMVAERGRVARYLLEKYRPDFFMVTFIAPDRIQHAAGQALTMFSQGNLDSPLAQLIIETYRRVDVEIQRLLGAIDETWTVLLISDHGATSYQRVFGLNFWLAAQRFLRLARPLAVGALRNNLRRLQGKALAFFTGNQHRPVRASPFSQSISWKHTQAYSLGAFGSIFINLRGREPEGTVDPGSEYEAVVGRLAEMLLAARDPQTGRSMVKAVHRGQDIYQGPLASEAPDLLLETEEDYYIRSSLDESEWHLMYPAGRYGRRQLAHTGKHTRDGILIAHGPLFQPGQIQGARIQDLAPTILYLFGLPIPADMDGEVLSSLFPPEALAQNPPQRIEVGEELEQPQEIYGPQEREEIEERLKGLGYLG